MIKKDIKEFIIGKYYRYLGNAQRINWATDGEMNFALDGEWRECLMGYNTEAKFKDIGSTCLRSKRLWSWVDGLELWEECDHNPDEFFKVGYWYKWNGEKKSEVGYIGDMICMLDCKWRKCICIDTGTFAKFEGMEVGWNWFQQTNEDPVDFYLKSKTDPNNCSSTPHGSKNHDDLEEYDKIDKIVKEPFFKVGWWYKSKTGESSKLGVHINTDMELFFDGSWHKCVATDEGLKKESHKKLERAAFEETSDGSYEDCKWNWASDDKMLPDFFERRQYISIAIANTPIAVCADKDEKGVQQMECFIARVSDGSVTELFIKRKRKLVNVKVED